MGVKAVSIFAPFITTIQLVQVPIYNAAPRVGAVVLVEDFAFPSFVLSFPICILW
jgi:hypothetical protein